MKNSKNEGALYAIFKVQNIKIIIFDKIPISVGRYGAEGWTMTSKGKNRNTSD